MDTKKLRQKILDLAIRGKLVPQDPNDEPASVLLERIRAEKERLIAEGKIKRSKKSATSDTSHYENVPFELPEGWCWTTIGEVSSSILYGVSESAKETGAYKLLRITDIQDNKVNWDSVPHTDFDKEKALNYLLQDGDILFARTGATVGKSYLVSGLTEESIYASYLIRVQTSQLIFPEYIKRFFESGYYWEQITLSSVGIGQPNVNGTTLANLNVPIPPYKEQLRIVEETNRWLAIADILDENTGHVCKAIESAKAKILDLAIHGKLVPQEPNDEPASVLLKRVNPKAVASCDNPHYENVPNGWIMLKGKYLFESMKSTKPTEEFFKYIDIDSIDNRIGIVTAPKVLPSQNAPSRASRYTCKGDVLFSMVRPYLRNIAIVPENNCIASTGFFVCHPIPVMTAEFCYFLMKSSYIVDGLNQFMKGDNSPSINNANITDWIYPIPPLEEQNRIVKKIKKLYGTIDCIAEALL